MRKDKAHRKPKYDFLAFDLKISQEYCQSPQKMEKIALEKWKLHHLKDIFPP